MLRLAEVFRLGRAETRYFEQEISNDEWRARKQNVVEKMLRREGLTKEDLGREEFAALFQRFFNRTPPHDPTTT